MDMLQPHSTPKTEAEDSSEISGQNAVILRKTYKTRLYIKS